MLRLIETGEPITFEAIKAAHPETSFPPMLSDAALAEYGVERYEPEAIDGPPPVPKSVTPLQIRKALRQSGLKTLVDSYIETLDEEVIEEWEYALEIRRDNPTLAAAVASLGMTESQADDLFRLAGSLT